MTTTHRKFAFDTVFDDAGGVASQPVREKRFYTSEEVEAERVKAYAAGERSVTARTEQAAAAALAEIAATTRTALQALAQVAQEHRTTAAQLALACGRTIAGAALEKFPEAPVVAAIEALAREIEAQPRLVVRTSADVAPRMQATLDHAAEVCGFTGQVLVKSDLTLPPAAFMLEWGDGRAAFDPVEAASRVEAALNNALAAEGLHAEPLIPQAPAPGG